MSIVGILAFTDNYIWSIIDETSHSMICVDPGDAEPVLTFLDKHQLALTHILITHHHHDHAGGISALKKAHPDVIIAGPKDNRIPLVNTVVRDEDIIHINQYDFRVLNIPGHTSTHICFIEPSRNWLFCGDTLFSAGCGRVFDGSLEMLFHSLQLLKNLPDDTKVYCGHEYTRQNLKFAATIEPENEAIRALANYLEKQHDTCSLPSNIALEKKINPFLRTDSEPLKAYAKTHGIDLNNELELFKLLREKKDNFT